MKVPTLGQPNDDRQRRGPWMWLVFALAALGLSTLQALLLVAARLPGLGEWLPVDAFQRALVLHVDLSLLVWFGAFAAALWGWRFGAGGTLAPLAAVAGSLLMLGVALAPEAQPLINNYVPVFDSPAFIAGLALHLAAVSWAAAAALARWRAAADLPARLALAAAAVWLAAVVMIPVAGLPAARLAASARGYFELLFWGAGHVMQFSHALLLLACWLWLSRPLGRRAQRAAGWVLAPGLALLALIPLLPWLGSPAGAAGRGSFTLWMEVSGWLLVVPLALLMLPGLRRQHRVAPITAALLGLSIVLYLLGAGAGSLIRGEDLMVPAHYHGAIGAVTLAYMGMAYRLIGEFGAAPAAARWRRVQVALYGGGTLVLILGLGLAGWGGLARKAPDPAAVVDWLQWLGIALAGAGGVAAVLGSLLFVVIGLRAFLVRAAWQSMPGSGR